MSPSLGVKLSRIPARLYQNLRKKGVYGTIDVISKYIGINFYHRLHGGLDIMELDWDVLIIFDAARADLLEEYGTFEAHCERVRSPATHSWRYMQRQYSGRRLHDTVMVSANPYVNELADDIFHAVYQVIPNNGDVARIEPELVTEQAIEANQRHPNKRLIIHYMQPHTPYLQFRAGAPDEPFVRARLTGDLDQLYSEYVENYRYAENEALDVIEELDGRVTITADHGEALGERWLGIPMFGHGHWMPEVYEVPLLTVESETRPEIFPEEPVARNHISDDLINEQLEALGYR